MKLEIRGISANMVGMRAILPDWAMAPSEPDKEIGGGYNDPASRDITNLHKIGKALLNDRECQHSEREMKQPEDLPVPPTPLRNPMMNPPKTFRDQCCHSRIKTDLQNLSMEQEPEWQQGSSPIAPALHLARISYGYKASKGLQHCARLRSNAENKSWKAKWSMAVQNQPTWDNLPGKEDNGSGRRHGDATRSGYADSRGVKESLLTDEGSKAPTLPRWPPSGHFCSSLHTRINPWTLPEGHGRRTYAVTESGMCGKSKREGEHTR
ncbi:hypothetical protein EV401DRAFT_2047966, partial [Pisolithus croceorrhizus]